MTDQLRGLDYPIGPASLTGGDTAVSSVSGGRPNEVLWWHRCPVQEGWVASGIENHTITGRLIDNSLTIRASLLCPDGCGKHGYITDLTWSDA